MAKRSRQSRAAGWIGRFTLLAIVADFFATMSYSTGAHIVLRQVNPALGAWWNAHEFVIMQLAATALGLLVGIRLAARLAGMSEFKDRAKDLSMIGSSLAAALILMPAALVSGRIARFRFGNGAAAHGLLLDRYGYDTGMFIDKLLNGWVYSIKMSAFALLLGMILFGLAVALLMTTGNEASPVQAATK